MRNTIVVVVFLLIIATSCKKTVNPFSIEKQNIGLLTDSTQVKDLEAIFSNDSILKFIKGDEFIEQTNDIEIYDTEGKKLLALTPNQTLDSTATIKSVQILDPRYKTAKGISTLSTFKDLKDHYKISRINNLISSVVVFVDELNASFTIDKKELPSNLRFDMGIKFEKSQIPDEAKIKHFFIHWN